MIKNKNVLVHIFIYCRFLNLYLSIADFSISLHAHTLHKTVNVVLEYLRVWCAYETYYETM